MVHEAVGVEVGMKFLKTEAELCGVRAGHTGAGVGIEVEFLKIGVKLYGIGAAHSEVVHLYYSVVQYRYIKWMAKKIIRFY